MPVHLVSQAGQAYIVLNQTSVGIHSENLRLQIWIEGLVTVARVLWQGLLLFVNCTIFFGNI